MNEFVVGVGTEFIDTNKSDFVLSFYGFDDEFGIDRVYRNIATRDGVRKQLITILGN